ncbi:MAG TPA: Gfo/Idh/MocA family oxidoreductase [Verrucomicrobiae bacterium]|jgi:predicted dehydrogenase
MNEPKTPAPVINRRSFLEKTSTAVAGGLALANLPIERFAHAAGSDSLKLALIGCGGRGTGAADHNINTHGLGELKLVAMADAHRDRLEQSYGILSKKHGDRVDVSEGNKFVGLDAYKEAISLCDVVITATPPGFRPMIFEEAVRQGKHVFMEKPVATDGPGVRKILAAARIAEQKGLKVAVGLQRHHQPNYIESMQRIHDGMIGDIVSMRCYWNGGPVGPKMRRADLEKKLGRPPTEMEYQIRNWYNFTWICGDHICEQHIHNLDVMNWVKNGHPVKCHGMGGRAYLSEPDHGEIFDHHAVEYEYADGSRMFSQCRQIPGCISDVSEAIVGTKGKWDSRNFALQAHGGDLLWRYRTPDNDPASKKGKKKQESGGGDDELTKYREKSSNDGHQLEHFPLMEAIRHNKPYNEAENGAFSSLTAIMGRMATYSGKLVSWEEALNSKLDLFPEKLAWDANPKVLPKPDGHYAYAIPGKAVAF